MFRISTVLMVGCSRLMNFGFFLKTEFARFIRPLESDLLMISGRIIFTTNSSMHNNYRFLSWVADPWKWVSNFLMLPLQLSKLEVVSLLWLKISLFTPRVPILLWSPILFLLSCDMHIMFLLPRTLSYCKPITNGFDWNVLSGDEPVIESCLLEFVKTCVTR